MTSASFNDWLTETRVYSPDRLQLTGIQAAAPGTSLTLAYNYGTKSNNGKVLSSAITRPGQTQIAAFYKYDALNRLLVAAEIPQVKAPPSDCSDKTSNWCEQYGTTA
jgi:hypothetical protein